MSENEFRCAVCTKAFGHGRALYVPTHKLWFHEKCFKVWDGPIGTEAFKRSPTAESVVRFAERDDERYRAFPAKLKER